ncbi:hypothetical protein HL658_18270 [Azospirillum sp. RWY-5-1]|uniref:Uncharacterized protein n=1 Tax=Azospirillum oleiclasticum TaxID=2735135 RepID=A0ABX2TJ70_9PROT|nr:hypothetical protein [Azospirillum oleiclasticum]NYZ14500.1 hypothetical protein [Azospirillum oleiclasticum]NYZ23148.1 hypothetical protein [Azospirillum oleiclasticum]
MVTTIRGLAGRVTAGSIIDIALAAGSVMFVNHAIESFPDQPDHGFPQDPRDEPP